MRIAVSYENKKVFQHFGKTERFNIYDIDENGVTIVTTINTNGKNRKDLPIILINLNVDTLICGGIGERAKKTLEEGNITLYQGVSGNADQAVKEFLSGTLTFHPDGFCSHQREHRHSACTDTL